MATKSKLLEMLEKNRGVCLSGEKLAQQLGVSRAAVWKAIKQLREEGYEICAVTNKGYTLTEGNDILSSEAIRCFLEHGEAEVQVFQEISSTSQVLKQMAMEKNFPMAQWLRLIVRTGEREEKAEDFILRGTVVCTSVCFCIPKKQQEKA